MIKVRFDELDDGAEFSISNYRYVKIPRHKVGKKYMNCISYSFYRFYLANDHTRLDKDYRYVSPKEYVDVDPEYYVSTYNQTHLTRCVGNYSSGLLLDIAGSLGLRPIMEKALKYDKIREALND